MREACFLNFVVKYVFGFLKSCGFLKFLNFVVERDIEYRKNQTLTPPSPLIFVA